MQAEGGILIVEDDPDVRGALATVLESVGYRIVEAEHGLEALQRLRTSMVFCLILLDLYMPTMNGWAFREEQMKDPSLAAIPVIVITADVTAARKAADLGAVASLTKPVDFDELLGLVARHC